MKLLLPLALFFFASCGYHFEGDRSSSDASHSTTITVPYVEGDSEGQLTNALVRALSGSGRYECVQDGGALVLNVKVVSDTNERIGFRYDRKEISGALEKNLFPGENRRTLCVEVTLVDAATGEVLVGPSQARSFAEYDYVDVNSLEEISFDVVPGVRETVMNFSLGQLDSIEGAQDDSAAPLYRSLAEKIVDGIIHKTW